MLIATSNMSVAALEEELRLGEDFASEARQLPKCHDFQNYDKETTGHSRTDLDALMSSYDAQKNLYELRVCCYGWEISNDEFRLDTWI